MRLPACSVPPARWGARQRLAVDPRLRFRCAVHASATPTDRTVPVSVSVHQQTKFGEVMKAVGDAPFLGAWDAAKTEWLLQWTDGHIWRMDAMVPVGTTLHFKVRETQIRPPWQRGTSGFAAPCTAAVCFMCCSACIGICMQLHACRHTLASEWPKHVLSDVAAGKSHGVRCGGVGAR